MKVFITGASGFIGRHLLWHAMRNQWALRLFIHKTEIPPQKKYELVRGDITDLKSFKSALKGIELLIHLAAAISPSRYGKETLFRTNVQGTENVLRAAEEAGVRRVIHFSSAGVLGEVEDEEVASESHPPRARNLYDISKCEGEGIALRFAQRGMEIIIVRPGWVYGPEDKRTFKLIKAIDKRRFLLATQGKVRQTPIYIDDLIKGVLLCIEKAKGGEIYHLAGSEVLQVGEIIRIISSTLGRKVPRLPLPVSLIKMTACSSEKVFSLLKKEAPLNRDGLSFFIHPKPLSIRKAQEELGFTPEVNFKKGIELSVSWYREHGWL